MGVYTQLYNSINLDSFEQINEKTINMELKSKIDFVKSLLPSHYEVAKSNKPGSIHCKSEIGIRKLPYLSKSGRLIDDDEDEETWDRFFKSIKQHFGDRFQEVYHNTCFCHVDFTIYLRS